MTNRKIISAKPISQTSTEQLTSTEIGAGPADEAPNALDSANGILEAVGSNCPVRQKGPKANSVRFSVEPRDVPPEKAARRLHLTLADFERKLPELFDRGFPRPDPTTHMFDLEAIDHWRRSRHPRLFRLTEVGEAKHDPQTARERIKRL
jgi:hypothetical protein